MQKIFLFLILILLLFLSCQTKDDQILTEDEATVILKKLMETMSNADTTLAVEILHPDCELRYPLLHEPAKGIDACKKLIVVTFNTFSEFKGSIEDVNIKGDIVIRDENGKEVFSKNSFLRINTNLGDEDNYLKIRNVFNSKGLGVGTYEIEITLEDKVSKQTVILTDTIVLEAEETLEEAVNLEEVIENAIQ